MPGARPYIFLMSQGPWSRPPSTRRGSRRHPGGPGPWRKLLYWVAGLALLLLVLIWLFPDASMAGPGQVLALVTAVAIGSIIILSLRLQVGEFLRYGLIWGGIVAALAIVYAYRHDISSVAERVAAAAIPGRGYSSGEAMIFERGPNGHFRVEAQVKGERITFLVDTGASNVILSRADAKRIGIEPEEKDYFERYYTANGVVMAAPVLLEELEIGSIRVAKVRASVTQSDLGVSLLGMSFLNELSGFEIKEDRLILRP